MDTDVSAAELLQSLRALRRRARSARRAHWFALTVFGLVTWGAIPFYVSGGISPAAGCQQSGSGLICKVGAGGPLLGGAFVPRPATLFGRWATLYWVLAMVVGFAAIVGHQRRRARLVGVEGRLWPSVTTGTGLLVLVVLDGVVIKGRPFPDLWIRGTVALLIIAVAVAVLAALERSVAFAVFAAGFGALALLSCLYDEDNVVQSLGIGGAFGQSPTVVNLVLPAVYLLLGGLGFWLAGRRAGTSASLHHGSVGSALLSA